jgi:hypothetical protein
MKILLFLFMLTTLLYPTYCFADGNKFLADYAPVVSFLDTQQVDQIGLDKAQGMGFCLVLMQGILHVSQLFGVLCPPGASNNSQYARIVVKYLRDHPEKLHERDSLLMFSALAQAFPCKKTN